MKFPYKKSKNRFNLIVGLLWLVLFIVDIILDQQFEWFSLFKIVMTFFFLFQYFYGTTKKYFEITDEHIKMPSIPVKEIKIKDIKEIKKVFDEYEIKSEKTKIKISTQSLDKDYKDLFEEKIDEIKLLRFSQ